MRMEIYLKSQAKLFNREEEFNDDLTKLMPIQLFLESNIFEFSEKT